MSESTGNQFFLQLSDNKSMHNMCPLMDRLDAAYEIPVVKSTISLGKCVQKVQCLLAFVVDTTVGVHSDICADATRVCLGPIAEHVARVLTQMWAGVDYYITMVLNSSLSWTYAHIYHYVLAQREREREKERESWR